MSGPVKRAGRLLSNGAEKSTAGKGEPMFVLTDAEEIAKCLLRARKVLIVPGFGVALSRSPKELCEVTRLLLGKTQVRLAVSPLAGRFAGHISLFLEEVPSHFVISVREANAALFSFDAALVIGASDIVNPETLWRVNQKAGMVAEVWRLPSVFWIKKTIPSQTQTQTTHGLLLQGNDVRILAQDAKKSLSEIGQKLRVLAGEAVDLRNWPDLRVSSDFPSEAPCLQSQETRLRNGSGKMLYTVGVLRDPLSPELLPLDLQGVGFLQQLGFDVRVEEVADAQTRNAIPPSLRDEAFVRSGATVASRSAVLQSQVILHADPPSLDLFQEDVDWNGKILVGRLSPSVNKAVADKLAQVGATAFSFDFQTHGGGLQNSDLIAFGIDLTASLETLRGYRAVMDALFLLPKIVKSLTTAAGKIEAAKVLVIGGGVSAMHAVAAGSRVGANVYLVDIGTASKEIAESCGAAFLPFLSEVPGWCFLEEAPAMKAKLERAVIVSDVVICAPSAFQGAPPKLVSDSVLRRMKSSAVVVDLVAGHPKAASGWGGCVQTSPSSEGKHEKVGPATVVNGSQLERAMPEQTARIFSECICNLLTLLSEFPNLQLPDFLDHQDGNTASIENRRHHSPDRLTVVRVLRSLVVAKDGRKEKQPSWNSYRGRRTLSRVSLLSTGATTDFLETGRRDGFLSQDQEDPSSALSLKRSSLFL